MNICCDSCGYTGKSKVRISGKFFLLISILNIFIFFMFNTVIGLILLVLSVIIYSFSQKHSCPKCNSYDVIVNKVIETAKTPDVYHKEFVAKAQPILPIEPIGNETKSVEHSPTNIEDGLMENFEKYAEFTRAQNWKGICQLNKTNFDSFGTKKELTVLRNHLEEDEVVFALTSGLMGQTATSNSVDFGTNTWLVVLTNERFLFLDSAMLTRSVDKQSIRLDKVQAISSSQGWMFGKIMVDLGSRMVVIDNCMKDTVAVVSDLANKWLKELQKQKDAPVVKTKTIEKSPIEKLQVLATLFASGALTEDEFKMAKGKILAEL